MVFPPVSKVNDMFFRHILNTKHYSNVNYISYDISADMQ
jgi:hypothetical protein